MPKIIIARRNGSDAKLIYHKDTVIKAWDLQDLFRGHRLNEIMPNGCELQVEFRNGNAYLTPIGVKCKIDSLDLEDGVPFKLNTSNLTHQFRVGELMALQLECW